MKKVKFAPSKVAIQHECETKRFGDWIVFTCPKCHDYERRFNRRTGEMQTKGSRIDVNHSAGSQLKIKSSGIYQFQYENINEYKN